MLFNSFTFFLFLLFMIFFIAIVQDNKKKLLLLIIGSLAFYAYHSLVDLVILLFSVLLNFFISKKITNKRIGLLALGIFFNVMLLIYFKYAHFIVNEMLYFFNMDLKSTSFFSSYLRNDLPLGISFFTFQQIMFMVDSYLGVVKEKNLLKYFLLVSFFPHSIAGPLVRYGEIAPQMDNLKITYRNLSIGLSWFFVGMFKKVILADNLAPCVDAVFDNISNGYSPTIAEAWFSTICYSLQIYFDFSGYSDMAIGLAKIFGITFPMNFLSPYKATSMIDFWRRWHVSLSSFFRDYVYIPLGGGRMGDFRKSINIIIVMILAGAWHGANWTFICWGSIHGGMLVLNHMYKSVCNQYAMLKKITSSKLICRIITLLLISMSWVVFRAADIGSALIMIKSLIGINSLSFSPYLKMFFSSRSQINFNGFFANNIFYWYDYIFFIISGLIIALFFPNSRQYFGEDSLNSESSKHNILKRYTKINTIYEKFFLFNFNNINLLTFLTMIIMISIALLSLGERTFLYFQF